MTKRLFDVTLSALGLVMTLPIWLPSMVLIYLGDRRSPFYVAGRAGRDGRPFQMIKLRSMVVGADKTGVDSTGANDARITPVGAFIRRYKVDELPQLINVLKGEMSLVGPRPNVERETALYSHEEKRLLSVRPGITDLASIVFSDEGEILADAPDPDLAYNQLIRPWKSRLGLVYVERRTLWLDAKILWLTAVSIASRDRALAGVAATLRKMDCQATVCQFVLRQEPLRPTPPPGMDDVVRSR